MSTSVKQGISCYCVVLFSVGLGIAAGDVRADFVIEQVVNYSAGARPSGLAPGDFDGDGDVDLATTAKDADRIVVLTNDGLGTFELGSATLLPASSNPQDAVSGDLNGDGMVDLAVAVRDPQGAILVMLNDGAGGFVINASVGVGSLPGGLAIGDMDGDGDLDLAVANRNSDTASVLTNDGSGGFTAATLTAGGEPRAAAFVDFDGDGDLDLAITSHDDRTVGLYTNSGGNFTASGSLSVGGEVRPEGITAADLDGDGDNDLAVAVNGQTPNISQAIVFLSSNGSFGDPIAYNTAGRGTGGIAAIDLDCDGAIDLAVTNRDSNNTSVLQNLGGAVFSAPLLASAGNEPGAIATADLDGDGDLDIAAVNHKSNNVSVFINNTCQLDPQCAEDFECDDGQLCNGEEVCVGSQCQAGMAPNCDDDDACTNDSCNAETGCANVDVACPAGQACDPADGVCKETGCDGDLNGDGVVNVPDLIILLGNWGACN